MALYYKSTDVSRCDTDQHGLFELPHKPGDVVPESGIYRCKGCNSHEDVCVKGNTFPPREDHNCTSEQIVWRLVVLPVHKKKQ